MRTIIVILLTLVSTTLSFASNNFECDEGFQRTEYQLNNVGIIACNCNCSVQKTTTLKNTDMKKDVMAYMKYYNLK